MRTYKIYTAGKMGGLSYEEQMGWRLELEVELRAKYDYGGRNARFIHPPCYY